MLKRKELTNILDFSLELLNIRTYSTFTSLVMGLKGLFDFDFVHIGAVYFSDEWKMQTFYTNLSVMKEWSPYQYSSSPNPNDPVYSMVSAGKTMMWWEELPPAINNSVTPSMVLPNLCGYSFSKVAPDKSKTAVISFGGREFIKSERTEELLYFIYPHLANAYYRLSEMQDIDPGLISGREMDVLRWLKVGKTSWEISKILEISENTVNFHIKNIKRKLNATNRQHAVAIAIANSIIS